MPNIQLYFLQASRCIRTAWLLDELNLDYAVEFSPRVNGVAPPEFKKKAGGLGKFPTLVDDGKSYYESGNITEYLCDTYDKEHRFLAALGDPKRYQILQWVHAAEGTFMTHALAITYARWFQKGGDLKATEEGLSGNVQKDFDWFEAELNKSKGKFLFGDEPTAGDIAMHFSVTFIIARELGTQGRTWPRIEQFVKDCEATEAYKKAVKKTGYEL
ncbi:hypothetical protein AMS68_006696 [Peltaster fructicola]|uniref:GST N-terminal domain-containing protein n=1 Tax=Peltaster fructicola TaxID=286661 RepID=A0A6H0Y2U8_9PEZI|nr:hypothetical protein AMS68_006696 [Peltaster fructicola]